MKQLLRLTGLIFSLALLLFAYNGLRHLVIWGDAEEVIIASDGINIACTFTKPGDEGPYPTILELLGSGPETRGEVSYRVNANNLLRHGFAVMFCDKRGSGDSGGEYATATFAEFTEDAIAAVRYLAARDDVRPDQLGLLTNSESGWYAPEVAATTGQVAFIMNRVGPPLSWIETVRWEARNEILDAGVAETDVDALLDNLERRWRFYAKVGEDRSADGPERDELNAELALLRDTVPHAADILAEKLQDYDPDFYHSYAIDANCNPADYLRQLDIPLLYIFGGVDVNIPTADSVAFLEEFEKEYRGSIDVVVYPDLGHPLATWRGILHAGNEPDYLAVLGSWARQQITQNNSR